MSGSTVYAGGIFTTLCGAAGTSSCAETTTVPRNRLAAINADGTLAAWNPNASGQVNALAVSGSTVYAGGGFTTLCGAAGTSSCAETTTVTRNRLAAINADGTLAAWNPNASGQVNALAVSGSTVYAGGGFTTLCGAAGTSSCAETTTVTRNRLAAINADGTLAAWNPNANTNVSALAVSGSTVYAGGIFTTLCGAAGTSSCAETTTVPRNRLAAINADGTLAAWNPNASGQVNALAVSGSTVYAGGGFTTLCGAAGTSSCAETTTVTRNRLAAINADGTLAAWNPDANSTVRALAVSGATLRAGGGFTTMGYPGRNGDQSAGYFIPLLIVEQPISPTTVKVTPADGGASVSWTKPDYTGTGITGYRVESAPGPNYDTWFTRVADTGSTATSASITGLTNGTNYRVRVTALVSGGAGGTSIASQWFTPNAPTLIPDAPTGIGATPGNGSLTLTWTPPANWGTDASGKSYRGFVFSGGTLIKFCNVNVPASQCTVTGLANGSPYTVSVRSFNNLGKYSVIPAPAGPYTPTP